jgi:hypothetical protein
MNRARRYAAKFLFCCLYVAFTPLAILHAVLEWVLDRCEPLAESLEVIANDD